MGLVGNLWKSGTIILFNREEYQLILATSAKLVGKVSGYISRDLAG